MLSPKRLFLFLSFFGIFLGNLWAQVYLQDLKAEDLSALDQRLKSAGLTYKTEPLVGLYLTVGKNADFLGKLLEKGSNPNLKAPNVVWSPLSYAVMQNLPPTIVSLLLQSGAVLEARVAGSSGNVIDAALDKEELQNASLLVKANQRRLKASRLAASEKFKDYPAFFLDDLDLVRNILRYGDFSNSMVWNLALAGNSRKVLKYLIDFQIEPNFNAPGSRFENAVGIDLLASNLELLKYLLSDGLSRDEVNFDKLYLRFFAAGDADSVRALRSADTISVRPELYRPALASGLPLLQAVTNNLDDLTKPGLFDTSGAGSGAAVLSGLLFGEGSQGSTELPLVVALYEKSDFLTIVPLLTSSPSETGLAGLYRYALAKKKLDLVKGLLSIDTKKVRPELYAAALDSGADAFKLLTHELADLKNPSLYGDLGRDNGRENLVALLLRSEGGRKTLLETFYEKTDFATALSVIQALNPPAELLARRSFSAAYEEWLNRDKNDILTFGFSSPEAKGSLSGTQITVTVPAETDVTALVAQFALSGGQATIAGVTQVSGVTVNDFSAPVSYLVTAQDGSKKIYAVTVQVAPLEESSTQP